MDKIERNFGFTAEENDSHCIEKAIREVVEIRNGRLPKRSYKEMIERVKLKLNEEGCRGD